MSELELLKKEIEVALRRTEDFYAGVQQRQPGYQDKKRLGRIETLRQMLSWVEDHIAREQVQRGQ